MSDASKETGQGLILINTGDGKGKTTAALGTIFRALGRNMECAIVQYIKGKWKTGERIYADQLEHLTLEVMGLGFTWDSDDLDKDKKAAIKAWEKSKTFINDDTHHLVVLDEITYAINYNFIELEDVLETLKKRPLTKHVIITGRNCPEDIIELADLVTEMKMIKHPYKKGIPAQKGIDF